MVRELSVADFFAHGMAAAREMSELRIREHQAGLSPERDKGEVVADQTASRSR